MDIYKHIKAAIEDKRAEQDLVQKLLRANRQKHADLLESLRKKDEFIRECEERNRQRDDVGAPHAHK